MDRAVHRGPRVHLSGFNLYVGDCPEPGTTLVHNTVRGSFAELDTQVLVALRKVDAGEPLDAFEETLVDPEDVSILSPQLFEDGILVSSREEEDNAYRERFRIRRAASDRLTAYVSTTWACNLACTYCVQADVLDGKTASPETIDRMSLWLASRAEEIGAREIKLVFLGGEALLHPDRIERLLADLRGRTRATVMFGLSTNGIFLTRALVERWIPLGFCEATVTLDGDETTHDLTRPSRKPGGSSFATIFRNVLDAAPLIRVTVKGNFQPDTLHGFVPLLRKLREAGLPPRSSILFVPALEQLGAPPASGCGCDSWADASPETMVRLSDEILRAGFDPGDMLTSGPCGFHQRHHYAIDPEGRIYKCPGFQGHPEWAIGHVSGGLGPRYDELVRVDVQDGCGACAHRPHCAGGCVASGWIKAGHVEGSACEHGFYSQAGAALLARKYELEQTGGIEQSTARFIPRADLPKTAPRPPRGVRANALSVVAH